MKDNRGVIGAFTVDFWMIIIEVLILLIYLIGSSVVNELDSSEGGIKVAKEGEIGLGGINNYMEKDFVDSINLKVKVSEGGAKPR